MAFVAITLLAFPDGASPLGLSAIIGAYFVPAIVLGIPGGITADRLARRSVMVLAEAVRVVIALVLALAGEGVWLIPMVLVFSSLTYLFYPSRQASIPNLVPKQALLPANAAISANLILGFAIGPALGWLVVAFAGPGWALVIAAGVMAVGVAIIASIGERSIRTPARDEGETAKRILEEGISALRGRPMLWHGLVIVGFVMFAVGGGAVGLVIYGDVNLGMGEEGFSLLLSAIALGTLVGAVVIGQGSPRRHKGRLIVAATFLAGAGLFALSYTDYLPMALAVMFLVGVAASMVLVPFTTMLQEQLGDHVMGTNFGVLSMGLTTPMVVGIGVAGPIIDTLDVLDLFRALALTLVAVGGVTLFASQLWSEDKNTPAG